MKILSNLIIIANGLLGLVPQEVEDIIVFFVENIEAVKLFLREIKSQTELHVIQWMIN